MRPRSMARTLAGTVKEILGSAQVFNISIYFFYFTLIRTIISRVLDALLMEKIHMI